VKNVPNHKCPDIMCAKILALQSREAVASPLEQLTLHHQVRTAVACFEKLAIAIQDSQAVDFTVTDVQNYNCRSIMCAKLLALQSREAVASPVEHLTLHHPVCVQLWLVVPR
jgi:hypothetical protein